MELFGLADCNNFYCSCERVFRPDLNGKPVVVLSNNDGCVIARSNESKALGLKTGDVFYQIKNKLEENGVAIFSSNYNLYGDMSRRVMSLLNTYTPKLEIYSIDEAFLDLSNMGDREYMENYGREIVKRVSKSTGIPISLGMAPTRTLAKMASKFAKKYKGYQGACLIDNDENREKALKLFNIEDVWGIGRQAGKLMNYYSIKTAWDFSQMSESWVKKYLHIGGVRTWKELNGMSCINIDELPQKKSICTSRSFPNQGLSALKDMEEAVANFAAQTCLKLREQHGACTNLSVFAWTSPFKENAPKDQLFETHVMEVATSSQQEIVRIAEELLRQHWDERNTYYYKKAGVIAWGIVPDEAIQLSLFDTIDRDAQNKVSEAMDRINKKNGHNTVRMAIQGFGKNWKLKNEHLSQQYTTNLRDIIRLKIK